MLNKHVFLDMLRHFILFQDVGEGQIVKIVAAYHQYYAVNKAVENTLRASSDKGMEKEGSSGIRMDPGKA